jgi:hypothetical protein
MLHAEESQILGSTVQNLFARNLCTLDLRYIRQYIIRKLRFRKRRLHLTKKIKIRRIGNVLGKQDLCNKSHSSKNKCYFIFVLKFATCKQCFLLSLNKCYFIFVLKFATCKQCFLLTVSFLVRLWG